VADATADVTAIAPGEPSAARAGLLWEQRGCPVKKQHQTFWSLQSPHRRVIGGNNGDSAVNDVRWASSIIGGRVFDSHNNRIVTGKDTPARSAWACHPGDDICAVV